MFIHFELVSATAQDATLTLLRLEESRVGIVTEKQPYQSIQPMLMVFCILFFGLSIGAFDRFAPEFPNESTQEALTSKISLDENPKTLVTTVMPQHVSIVDVQQIIDEHVEEVSSPKSLAPTFVPEASSLILAPDAAQTSQLEEKLIDSIEALESSDKPAAVAVVLIGTENSLMDEPAPAPAPLQARSVALPRVPAVKEMMPTRSREFPIVTEPMAMSETILIARAINETDTESTAPMKTVIDQAEGAPLDIQPEFWPASPQLQRQLTQLAAVPILESWAKELKQALANLHELRGLGTVESVQTLALIRNLHVQGVTHLENIEMADAKMAMQRTLAGLDTRLDVWHAVQMIVSNQKVSIETLESPRESVAAAIEGIEERLVGSDEAENWRVYLNLEELQEFVADDSTVDVAARGKEAQRVLLRMHARTLTPEQKTLLQEEAFTSLEFGLRQWCVEPIDYPKLMRDIELFETSRYNYRAVPVANSFQVIRWSLDDNVAALGNLLEQRYRAGNIRIRIAEEFINRLIPGETQSIQPVEDKVFGAMVEGTSETTSRLNIKLLDDDGRWLIGLDAQGDIKSNTTSTKGAAVFENEASASFQASKKLMISPSGIEFGETVADVQSESKLVNFETDYDNSLLGGIARNMAKNQYKQKEKSAAKAMDLRIRQQATDTLDDKITEQMGKMESAYTAKWLEPMRDLNLRPVATQLHTVDNKLAIDYRLAGVHQLAAHGFRPELPDDTLVGMQIHESALNNLLHNLDLDGKSGKLVDVMQRIAEQLGMEEFEVPVDVSDSVMVRFMERESVRLRFYKGKVQLMIQMRQLQNKRVGWRNFAILAEYAPDTEAISGNLQREGVIQILGNGLRLGDRIALQTIFNKVLPSTRTLRLLGENIATHPNMETTTVNMFSIQQGWLTFAITESKPVIATTEDSQER